MGAEPFAQQARIAAGAFGQLLRADRLAVGHGAIQAEFVAENDVGEHGGAAHVGHQLAHEIIQLGFVHCLSSFGEGGGRLAGATAQCGGGKWRE
ncbi:hypothetical protein FQZ97_1063170 [compost metagenome]